MQAKTITDFLVNIQADIDSMLDSMNDKKAHIEALEKGRAQYFAAGNFGRVRRYDTAIDALRYEVRVLQNLIEKRVNEKQSVHFQNVAA